VNLESRIERLEKLSAPNDELIYLVWLPKECETTEEWLNHTANPDQSCEWYAISARGAEQV
jgi:hypothetical protein